MTGFHPPPVTRTPRPSRTLERAAVAYLVAGVLGGLSFVWGFLPWYTAADGQYLSGYALRSAGTGAIALSLLTGAVAVGYVVDRRPPAVLPTLVAAAAVLLMIGTSVGRDDFGADVTPGSVGVGAGLILEFVTVVSQAAALLTAWLVHHGRLGTRPVPGGHPAQHLPTQHLPAQHLPAQHPQAGPPRPDDPDGRPWPPPPSAQPYGPVQ